MRSQTTPMTHNLLLTREKDVDMAIGVVGELGAGKATVMKAVCVHAARSAAFVTVDRSAVEAWVTTVSQIRDAVVVKIAADADVSFDPLRGFVPVTAPDAAPASAGAPVIPTPATRRAAPVLTPRSGEETHDA